MQFISLILLLILNIYSVATSEFGYGRDRNTEEFDWSLTKEVLNNECTGQNNCNVILSPFVTKLSLYLLKDVSTGNSESLNELSILLPELSRFHEYEYWRKTLGSLKEKNKNNSVLMGSLIALNKGVSVGPTLVQKAKILFNSELQTYDFSRIDEAVEMLNDFVISKTDGNIKDIVNSDFIDGAQAIILNTIYFKAEWQPGFNTTFEGDFLVDNNDHIKTIFMKNDDYYHYTESKILDSQLIRMDYRGEKYAMFIVLPNKVDGLQNVINNLDANILENEISKMVETDINLTIPKFKFESSFSLAKHLKKLGIKKIFTPEANIHIINSNGSALAVKDVVQKMGIEVAEVGTVAYGTVVTTFKFKIGGDSRQPIFVTIDHSFCFFIKDLTTGVVLFSGIVQKPEYSN